MQKVLIVSPHFPPVNTPDHQRVRMSLPHFRNFGWDPVVLTVQPKYVEAPEDSLLMKAIPADIKVISTKAIKHTTTRKIGLGNMGLRCLPYLKYHGDQIIRSENIDLVFFSTTVFPTMVLGPVWLKKFGVPYVLDFQDPWLNDYYNKSDSPTPPGGDFKFGLSQILAKWLEPYALRHMSHAISVSPAYPKMLAQRYGFTRENQYSVIPFGGSETDFTIVNDTKIEQHIFDPSDGFKHFVYVGRCNESMQNTLRMLFSKIQEERTKNPNKWNDIKLHFVGTNYAVGNLAIKNVEPIAAEFGMLDILNEHADRITYFESLKVLADSDGIILIGSNDPGYTASKIYPCILSGKPVLGLFHENSSVVEILKKCQAGRVLTFDSNYEISESQLSKDLNWFISLPKGYQPNTDWEEFSPYTAKEMTRLQCDIFSRIVR